MNTPVIARWIALATASTLALAACGAQERTVGSASAAGEEFPVTVESCGVATTYSESPGALVTNDINMTEMALALGLADRMVGIAGVADRSDVREDLLPAFDSVQLLSPKSVELEALLGAGADFFFAGWNYGMSEANGITPTALAERGIDSYAITESCARIQDKEPSTLEETYADIAAIGAIFGEGERAEAVITEMRAVVTEVADAVEGLPTRSVFVYDSGEDAPFTSPGLAVPNELIARAGGVNIFSDLAQTWGTVSWEEVIDRNPECIVIVDYGDITWERKRDHLRSTPALSGMAAVQDDCFVALPYSAMTPGVRNAEAVQVIAGLLHPEAFAGQG